MPHDHDSRDHASHDIPTVSVTAVLDDSYLLDVREADEWAAGHAPDAVHLPLSELADRAAEIPADRRVIVICRVGGRSAQAVAWLNGQGWDTINVDGGMLAWEAAGRPVVGDGDGPPTVI